MVEWVGTEGSGTSAGLAWRGGSLRPWGKSLSVEYEPPRLTWAATQEDEHSVWLIKSTLLKSPTFRHPFCFHQC